MGRTTERRTPTRLRLWTGAIVVLAAAALTTGTVAIADTQHGVNRVGKETAPLAQSASDLYFALSDLDSQTAREMLTIGDSDLDTAQGDAQVTLNSRVTEVDADLRQAIGGTSDQAVQGQFQTMLDKVTLYHDLSTTALSVDQLSTDASKGHPDPVALAYYSRATDVMHFDLLPVAAQIRDSYAKQLATSAKSQNDSWSVDTVLVLVTTLPLLAALLFLQLAMSVRFRRTLNPFLAVATVATVAFLIAGLGMTSQQTDRVQNAVNQRMTPYLGIQHARAVSFDAVGSIVRYTVAPNFGYDQGYAADLAALNGTAGVPGLLHTGLNGTDQALSQRAGSDWTAVQHDAGKIKSEVDGGDVGSALTEATGIAGGQLGQDFYALDTHLGQAADTQLDAFQATMSDARSGASGWAAVPAVVFGAVIALAVAGVWRRLAEYR
ncbi:hypothetical protein KGQ20_39550 [Catenulispora sp. NF23]|uniref:hypothetical protein n=1 Tax=Catenulispora pinistramenti TaxID=2705254 RepID=UPI001BADBD9D|nr:hypothetical protein [Catenulispora pinistramenti]MBS2538860.1 hypothetical protein [Catenulispora pinistramenti]